MKAPLPGSGTRYNDSILACSTDVWVAEVQDLDQNPIWLRLWSSSPWCCPSNRLNPQSGNAPRIAMSLRKCQVQIITLTQAPVVSEFAIGRKAMWHSTHWNSNSVPCWEESLHQAFDNPDVTSDSGATIQHLPQALTTTIRDEFR